jgi:hypothetical protein
MSTLDTQLSPLCSLPCSVRFTIWSMRVAWLSLHGADGAHARLREIGRLLQIEDGIPALERLLRLLESDAAKPLDIREFGRTACGERVLERYSRSSDLDFVLSAAAFWVTCLARSEIVLPHFEEVTDSGIPAKSWNPVHATMH